MLPSRHLVPRMLAGRQLLTKSLHLRRPLHAALRRPFGAQPLSLPFGCVPLLPHVLHLSLKLLDLLLQLSYLLYLLPRHILCALLGSLCLLQSGLKILARSVQLNGYPNRLLQRPSQQLTFG